MKIIQLIPFKIKALPLPDIKKIDIEKDMILWNFLIGLDIRGRIKSVEGLIVGKEWTVVGEFEGMFLLLRPGEITQWYPRSLCQAIGVE